MPQDEYFEAPGDFRTFETARQNLLRIDPDLFATKWSRPESGWSIKELDLSPHAHRRLLDARIRDIRHLLEYSPSQLLGRPGFGTATLDNVMQGLARFRLYFPPGPGDAPPGDEWVQFRPPYAYILRSRLPELEVTELDSPGGSSLNAFAGLNALGVRTLGELLKFTGYRLARLEWYRLRGPWHDGEYVRLLPDGAVEQLRIALHRLGLALKGDPPPAN